MCDVMIDRIDGIMPDPFGFPIFGGEMIKVDENGEVDWASKSRKLFEGSHSANMQIRNICHGEKPSQTDWFKEDRGLEFWGNPAKFLQGHNIFGPDNPRYLVQKMLDKITKSLSVSRRLVDLGQTKLKRVDITGHWQLDSEAFVLPFLAALEERCWIPRRGRGVKPAGATGTLVYGFKGRGARASPWQLKLYCKGLELQKRPPPCDLSDIPKFWYDMNRTIRVEVTLRTQELKRNNAHLLKNWQDDTALKLWQKYVSKLDLGTPTMNLEPTQLRQAGLKPRHIDAVLAWKAGGDLRASRSAATFYRLVKEIRDATGMDLRAAPPSTNIVPLVKVVEARPATFPNWSDQLTEAMRRAA